MSERLAIAGDTIREAVKLLKEAADMGIVMVVVHKPDCYFPSGEMDEAGVSFSDAIISNSSDPKVIAALLGNYCSDEGEADE